MTATSRRPARSLGLALFALALATLTAPAGSAQVGTITRPARSLGSKIANTLGRRRAPLLVRDVTVRAGSEGSTEVEIKGSDVLKPVTTALANPERIVIDLPNARCDPRRIPVNADDVGEVTVTMFQQDPPVARIEVQLGRPHSYELLSSGKTATVKIGAALPQTETANAPVNEPPQPPVQVWQSEPAATKLAEPSLPSLLDLQIAELASPPEAPPPQIPEQHRESSPAQDAQGEPKNLPASLAPAPAQDTGAEPMKASASPPAETPTAPTSVPTPENAPEGFDETATTAHQSAKGQLPGIVRNVTLLRVNEAAELHIEGDQLLHPSVTFLADPARIVVDLPNVALNRPLNMKFDGGDVRELTASIYLVNPPVTRVVVNLDRSCDYQVRESGPEVTVHIEGAQLGKERKARYRLVGRHGR